MRQQFGQAGAELPPPTTGMKSLCDALEATKQTAQLLDEFLHRRVMREDDLDKDPRIRKRTWLVVKPQLSTFKSQFYSHREHLCRALHVASL